MSTYYREQGYHRRRRLWHIVKVLVIILFLVAAGVIGFLGYDIYRQSKASDTPSASTTPITSTISSDSQVFRNQYFQIQTSDKWRAISNETKDGHYVYRQFNGTLVEQELVIDVNQSAPEILALVQTTRVLPVAIQPNGTLKPSLEVSDHCQKAAPKDAKNPQSVKYKEVTFNCSTDGRSFIVVVGQIGGGTTLNLQRPSGEKATYKLTYKNVTANPTSRDLINIVESFVTR